jgi:hypothetical protein
MINWGLNAKIGAVIAFLAVYFPIALCLKYTYQPLPAGVAVVAELKRPFFKFSKDGYDFASAAPALDELADFNDAGERSPFILYENERPLGPAHAMHADIAKLGHGRFSHWKGVGFIMSSSDGTNPTSNGRRYSVARRQ